MLLESRALDNSFACEVVGLRLWEPQDDQTIDELRARIARTVDYLKGVPASALEGSEDRAIRVPAGPDKFLDFKGLDFIQRWAIPNVFFHLTTAYAILRHNGVDIGKRDFLG